MKLSELLNDENYYELHRMVRLHPEVFEVLEKNPEFIEILNRKLLAYSTPPMFCFDTFVDILQYKVFEEELNKLLNDKAIKEGLNTPLAECTTKLEW